MKVCVYARLCVWGGGGGRGVECGGEFVSVRNILVSSYETFSPYSIQIKNIWFVCLKGTYGTASPSGSH